jgi:hypothetical protein
VANALVLTNPDLICWDDVDAFGRETTSDLETLFQDFYHFLIEDPGTNIDDPRRGIGVGRMLSGPVSGLTTAKNKIDQLGPEVFAGRIDTCATTISGPDDQGVYTLAINVGVDGVVYGLQFAWNQAGLSVVSSGGMA